MTVERNSFIRPSAIHPPIATFVRTPFSRRLWRTCGPPGAGDTAVNGRNDPDPEGDDRLNHDANARVLVAILFKKVNGDE